MTVYVDNANIQASVKNGGRTHESRWAHLTADTKDELHAFAVGKLGLKRSYFQDKPNGHWHYDVTEGKRWQAIRHGAVEIDCDSAAFEQVWHRPGREGVITTEPEPEPEPVPAETAARVIHLRQSTNGKRGGDGEVYIGRPSKWGNPFAIGADGTREEVIEKYRRWIADQPQLLADLAELRGAALVCYCAPQACHGDVLAELAETADVPVVDAEPGQPKRSFIDFAKIQARMDGTAPPEPPRALLGFRGMRASLLSNYANMGCEYDGRAYPTGEHAFAAAKTLDEDERDRIAYQRSPGEAKRLGRSVTLRPDWDSRVRYEAMREILASKFSGARAQTLLDTEDDLLVETNDWHDQHWGDCTCPTHKSWPGKNHLGRMLMDLRAQLRDDPADRWVKVMCTGHRDQHMSPEQRAWMHTQLARVAEKLIAAHGMRVAIHGGALGADLGWAVAAHGSGVEALWAYLPFPDQAARWPAEQKGLWRRYGSLRDGGGGFASRVEYLADSYDVRTLHARNDWMIGDSDAVVAVVDPEKTSGGTASALAKIGTSKPVIRLDIRNFTVKIARAR